MFFVSQRQGDQLFITLMHYIHSTMISIIRPPMNGTRQESLMEYTAYTAHQIRFTVNHAERTSLSRSKPEYEAFANIS
jgi:hypothetical protein